MQQKDENRLDEMLPVARYCGGRLEIVVHKISSRAETEH
jgi:hypothetical protein